MTTEEKKVFSKQLFTLLQEMGPFYQKIGQIASGFQEYLPVELTDTFKQFQEENWVNLLDDQELKETLSNFKMIKSYDLKPIASGTVAQIHAGYLDNGEKIAIKIAKKNARKLFESNLRVLKFVIYLASFIIPDLKQINFHINYLADNIVNQTDLSLEYKEIKKFQKNNDYGLNRCRISIPEVYGEPHRDVMIMKFIDAISAEKVSSMGLSDEKKDDLCKRLAKIIFDSSANDGIFHIDLHPGNLMYNKETDRLYLIDFGLMGYCDLSSKRSICELVALLSEYPRDYHKLVKNHSDHSFVYPPELLENKEFHEAIKDYLDNCYISGKFAPLEWKKRSDKIVERFNITEKLHQNPFNIAMLCLSSTSQTVYPEFDLDSFFDEIRK